MGIKTRVVVGAFTGAVALVIPFLETHEGVELKPYIDIAGVPTVCAGITGTDVDMKKTYTRTECQNLLNKHIAIHKSAVDKAIMVKVPDSFRAAMISFSYNVGVTGYRSSTVLKRTNRGNLKGACEALLMWNKATVKGKKVVVKGLVNRRNAERELCLKDL